MKVRLFTSVASAAGSWPSGEREVPDELAEELIRGGLATPLDGAKPKNAKASPKEAAKTPVDSKVDPEASAERPKE